VPYAYLSDAEVEEAIDQMNNGSYTQWLRRLSKEFNINPHDILTRQAVALGYKQEDIPPQPASLEQIYQTANEEMVCLINKIGLDNLPTATVKRLCFNLSEEGVNDEALRQELDVY
jgi:predicted metal-dependent TIM-barrel fold hydrolase